MTEATTTTRKRRISADVPVVPLKDKIKALKDEQDRLIAQAAQEAYVLLGGVERAVHDLVELAEATGVAINTDFVRERLVSVSQGPAVAVDTMTLQQANEAISARIKNAQREVSAAEDVADKFGIDFSMNLGDYGMGGSYDGSRGEWNSSSANC